VIVRTTNLRDAHRRVDFIDGAKSWPSRAPSMIARFRQIYDLVIIDIPPVLPVPDALILGRWADGALLTARCDINRFPQIKGALHQLDGAGITVMGIVLTGMLG
jgi:polysaccharide biosynthesis transport protein